MNIIFKVMAFMMFLNLATGIMITAVPTFANDPSTRSGLVYDSTYSDDFTGNLEGDLNPEGVMEDKGDMIYRVLDMMNVGFIFKFIQTVINFTFGFVILLDSIFGMYLDPTMRTFLFLKPVGLFYVLTTIGYIYAIWALWTGKDITSQ